MSYVDNYSTNNQNSQERSPQLQRTGFPAFLKILELTISVNP